MDIESLQFRKTQATKVLEASRADAERKIAEAEAIVADAEEEIAEIDAALSRATGKDAQRLTQQILETPLTEVIATLLNQGITSLGGTTSSSILDKAAALLTTERQNYKEIIASAADADDPDFDRLYKYDWDFRVAIEALAATIQEVLTGKGYNYEQVFKCSASALLEYASRYLVPTEVAACFQAAAHSTLVSTSEIWGIGKNPQSTGFRGTLRFATKEDAQKVCDRLIAVAEGRGNYRNLSVAERLYCQSAGNKTTWAPRLVVDREEYDDRDED